MASSEGYLAYVLDLLGEVPVVTHRKMMGEYMLYSEGVLFGGIYDDRFLLKDVPAARSQRDSRHDSPAPEAKGQALTSVVNSLHDVVHVGTLA